MDIPSERESHMTRQANKLYLLLEEMYREGFTLVTSGPFVDLADRTTGERTPVATGYELREWEEKFSGQS